MENGTGNGGGGSICVIDNGGTTPDSIKTQNREQWDHRFIQDERESIGNTEKIRGCTLLVKEKGKDIFGKIIMK